MSHSHSHAPGEHHSHSHGPPQTPLSPLSPIPLPDPAIQALIDQEYTPVPLKLGAETHIAVCDAHSLEKCTDCDIDFLVVNRMSRILFNNPNLRCPPPANVVTQKLTQMVAVTKDEGNTLFKKGQHALAIQRYTAAATFAAQRPPWEANQLMREELSTIISNRSAAYFEQRDYISALADAETVIQLRRNWGKGHFRKGKALHALGYLFDACEAIRLGLSFDPGNQELSNFLAELSKAEKEGARKTSAKDEQAESAQQTPVAA
ncbi:hypothetical protein APHAL10511_005732 [Amanita phalloides]|nr:hypothetical protein APHAL10511_005732 [Amanita phalloides]